MSNIRIIAGSKKGRRLKVPQGLIVRPTSDRVREALFSMLGDVSGLRVLDLFAGTGALGAEALSRGASCLVCVENNPLALGILKDNLRNLDLSDQAEVLKIDLAKGLHLPQEPFDLLLCDPPYGFEGLGVLLESFVGLLRNEGVAVVEHQTSESLEAPEGLVISDRRSWGSTAVTFFCRRD